MKIFVDQTSILRLNPADRKVVSDMMNEVLDAVKDWNQPEPFFFEYCNVTVMFAPDTHFFNDIPDAPLPSLGGHIDGTLILAAYTAANDRLPLPSEDSLL